MELRPFRPADLETLYKIDQACFPPGVSYSRPELARFIAHRNSKTWIAEGDEGVVGFLVAGRQPQRVGHIITVDVLDEKRRQGVGRALMDAAEEWARGRKLRLIYLETADSNLEAQRFYARLGYERCEKIEQYYSSGEAAWVYVKKLS